MTDMTRKRVLVAEPAAVDRTRRLPAETGIWVFVAGDLVAFGFFFVVYLAYRADQPALFAQSQRALSSDLGAVNTLLLLTSSLFVVLAVRATFAADRRVAPRLVLAAIACGVGFGVVKIFEYHLEIVGNHTPGTNHFFLLYFILTGLHLVHLVIGLGVLTLLWTLARRADELSPMGKSVIESCAAFWHLVDLLWIVIFPLLYLVR